MEKKKKRRKKKKRKEEKRGKQQEPTLGRLNSHAGWCNSCSMKATQVFQTIKILTGTQCPKESVQNT